MDRWMQGSSLCVCSPFTAHEGRVKRSGNSRRERMGMKKSALLKPDEIGRLKRKGRISLRLIWMLCSE